MVENTYEESLKNITIPYSEENIANLVKPIERIMIKMFRHNQKLMDEIKYLKSEAYKDEELAMWKSRYEEAKLDTLRGFSISEKEDERIKKWIDKHEGVHSGGHGCSGGRYSYHFVPTAIGTSGIVRCNCGAEFEFQEI